MEPKQNISPDDLEPIHYGGYKAYIKKGRPSDEPIRDEDGNIIITAGGQPLIPGDGWKSEKYVQWYINKKKILRTTLYCYIFLLGLFILGDCSAWMNHDEGDIQRRILLYRIFLYGGTVLLFLYIRYFNPSLDKK